MKDYRLPKSSPARWRGKPQRRTPTPSRTKTNDGSKWSFKAFFLAIVLSIVLLSIVGYGLVSLVIPNLFPLSQSKNIVIVSSNKDENSNQILIAHYRPAASGITAVKVSGEEPIQVIGGFGQYPLRSIWPLLTMEKKDSLFIRSAFSYATGEVIDGVVVTDEKLPTTQDELKTTLKNSIWEQQVEGLNLKDQLGVFFFTAHAPSDKFTLKQATDFTAWKGHRAKLALQFPESECPVAVVNTVRQPGLATAVSSMIEQSGYTVVRVTDSSDNRVSSHLYYDRTAVNCIAKAERLGRIFPTKTEVEPDSVQSQTYRAKIILELGQDLQGVIPEAK